MSNLFLNPAKMEDFLRDQLGASSVVRKGDEIWFPCILPWGGHEHSTSEESSFNVDKMVYNCFKCGSGGSLLWLIEVVLKVNSATARGLIEDEAAPEDGVISKESFRAALEDAWRQEPSKSMPRYPMRFVEAWACQVNYLTNDRGISLDVQREMNSGIIEDTEVIKGQEITQPRMVLPHVFGGKLRGWTMRKLDDRQLGPKWKHSEDFPKATSLYNFDNVRDEPIIIVVESPMSVLKLKTEGIHNVVATFGAEVNGDQIELLAGFPGVISFPDGDKAGYKAMARFDQRSKKTVGLVPELLQRTRMWIVDHGRYIDEDGNEAFNEKDPANYTGDEVRALLGAKIPAMSWTWRWNEPEKKKSKPKSMISRQTQEYWS